MKAAFNQNRVDIEKYLPGSSSLRVSSDGLGWTGYSLLEYLGDKGERPEQLQNRHILGLWRRDVATGERPNGRGGYTPYIRYPGTVTLIPPGIIRKHRAHNPYRVILCFLEPAFVNSVEEELDQRPTEQLQFRPNINDVPMRQLISLLADEAEHAGPSGRLYVDHLAHSIAIRLFFLGDRLKPEHRAETSPLPRHILSRVLDRMHHLNSELNLQTLAAETGYSRSHFLRMFRLSTGYTPHRYLLHLRLKRAQELLKQPFLSLIDIAAVCGFSSHAHLSRAFRQLLGVTPSEYRRNL
jgi:AraC family transcriptional regulator